MVVEVAALVEVVVVQTRCVLMGEVWLIVMWLSNCLLLLLLSLLHVITRDYTGLHGITRDYMTHKHASGRKRALSLATIPQQAWRFRYNDSSLRSRL